MAQDYEAKLRAVQEQLLRIAASQQQPLAIIGPSRTPARRKPEDSMTERQKMRRWLDVD